MFNNPLKKYRQGGQMSTEEAENQMAQALAEAFQIDPQVVKARIQEIRQNPKESKLFAQGLQMLQQGDQQNGMAILGELFKVASHKKGGKIDAFICKHKKGGVAGCGCKEDGGKVNKAKDGEELEDSAPERYYNEKGVPSALNRYTTRPDRMLYAEVPTPRGNINFEFNQLNKTVPGGLNLPIEYDVQTRSMLDDSGSVGQQQLPLYKMPYFSQLKAQGAAYQENGGVLKGQNSIPGGMPEIPAENKIYSEKHTTVKGPSIGQSFFGVRRPWLTQTVSFNPFSERNDTTYTGRDLQGFIPGYSDDLLKIRYNALPPAVKKNLAKVIDSDYEEYNSTYGSYPDNYYEKTITVKKRK